jgi:hypothetical protein
VSGHVFEEVLKLFEPVIAGAWALPCKSREQGQAFHHFAVHIVFHPACVISCSLAIDRENILDETLDNSVPLADLFWPLFPFSRKGVMMLRVL